MNLTTIEKAVALQKKAYGLLLWLKEQARRDSQLLNTDQIQKFQGGDTCVHWVHWHLTTFPVQYRPESHEVEAFARLLSPFFMTSFRMDEDRAWNRDEMTLVAGAKKLAGRRHKRHVAKREQETVHELKSLALLAIAEEEELEIDHKVIETCMNTSETAAQVTLWTYGRELVRRCEFLSQGTAVHRLWLEVPKKSRTNLSADTIWKARLQIAEHLKQAHANNLK
jgi:hypothetical protein